MNFGTKTVVVIAKKKRKKRREYLMLGGDIVLKNERIIQLNNGNTFLYILMAS